MGLIARVLEGAGIATVCLLNLRRVAERIRPPRTLLVDRPFGQIVGPPGDETTQRATLLAALDLFVTAREPGTVREFPGA